MVLISKTISVNNNLKYCMDEASIENRWEIDYV